MSDISFTCPHCNQHMDAPSEMAGDQLACPTCQKPIQVPTAVPVRLAPKRGPLSGRLIAGIVGGLILAIIAGNITSLVIGDPLAIKPSETTAGFVALVFLGVWAVSIVVAVKAAHAAKAWRRILISNACLSFALPLAGFVLAVRTSDHFESKGAHIEAAVSAGAGGIMALFLGIFGLFLGAIFLTVGLLVGRERKESK